MQLCASRNEAARLDTAVVLLAVVCLGGMISAVVGTQPVGEAGAADVENISAAGDATRQIIMLGIYGANLALLLWWFGLGSLRLVGLPLLALIAWCFISTAWSPMPDATLRRVVATLGPVIVGALAGLRFDERGFARLLQTAAAVTVIGSLVYAALVPSLAFDVHGQLRGLSAHKNELGSFMVVCALPIAFRIMLDEPPRLPHMLVLIGCVGCFVLTRSATPIVTGAAAFAALCTGYLFQKSAGLIQSVLPAIICVMAASVIIFWSDLAAVGTEMLGRDGSFSGRTNIWDFVLGMIGERPWVGYGYGIFWLGLDAPGALFWHWTKQFELHSHNGYLQLVLDAGLVGLLLLLASIGTLVARTAILAKSGECNLATFIAMFLVYYLVASISESALWQPNGLLVALYAWMTVRANLTIRRFSTARGIAWLPNPKIGALHASALR